MMFSGIADEAGHSIENQIRAHKQLGWKLIELRNVSKQNITTIDEREFDRVLGLVTAAGMQVSCFASAIGNWSRDVNGDFEIDRAELISAIPRMKRAGTKFIRIMSWNPGKMAPDEWKAEVFRRLEVLVKIAEDAGIVMAHENCTGWASDTPENFVEMLDTFHSSALVALWDTANALAYGKDGERFFAALEGRAAYVHIKDWMKKPNGEGVGVYAGDGQCRVPEQVERIMKTGYDGVFSVEPHVAAVIHTGMESPEEGMYKAYVEAGRRMVELLERIKARVAEKRRQ